MQGLRNVTFVLQKEKREIPNFDERYERSRETLAAWCFDLAPHG